MKHTLTALFRDRTGAAMIELGLIAPLLIFVILAVSDVAQGFSSQLQLKQAADRTIDLATVAGQRAGSYSYLQAEGANASGQPSSNVAVSSWLEPSHHEDVFVFGLELLLEALQRAPHASGGASAKSRPKRS